MFMNIYTHVHTYVNVYNRECWRAEEARPKGRGGCAACALEADREEVVERALLPQQRRWRQPLRERPAAKPAHAPVTPPIPEIPQPPKTSARGAMAQWRWAI
jgi:hypothetical protein